MKQHARDTRMLRHAARLALRGHGGAEPNPLVGCVVCDADGVIAGTGFHRHCGEGHAERHALDAASDRARGGTAYVTLEPCAHQGRTPPCTDAIIEAGIARVVVGSPDPNPVASGGMNVLQAAGIDTELREDVPEVRWLNAPFLHRIRTGRPWVLAKWAQTIDGRIATASGDSKWISGEQSRRMVHRERGRTDAILTGMGTVLADDPMMNAREVRIRRTAMRVVFDPDLATPVDSKLLESARAIPLLIACRASEVRSERAASFKSAGAHLHSLDEQQPLEDLLQTLAREHSVANVMVEAGGGLVGKLLAEDLIDAALVFTAPKVLGDGHAPGPARGLSPELIADTMNLELIFSGRRDSDLVAWYQRPNR
ncbi:MAG: bifunctional diaminohydroxyphosphoribosylaminopyrimidine deaminase/5-amino-6-(5-phosphoribosylamino)uracil reductase RibD [Phycisphaerales bacterium]|nr:bifunctional diaminohydroxyphosphoribosylaminopyrimidine deaminase/5-amino-6-(5-phosphoribosylamino)uracil reductase RibD [Phycisphaerales bacterium]